MMGHSFIGRIFGIMRDNRYSAALRAALRKGWSGEKGLRRFAAALVPIVALVVSGCSHPAVPGGEPGDIPFDLLVPGNIPRGDYNAIGGISIETMLSGTADSTFEAPARSYYAQFAPAVGMPLPARVLLNGNPLSRYKETDTLRLESAENNVFGDNLWALVDSTGDTTKFPAIRLDAVDSVSPFTAGKLIRGDTALRLIWKPPTVSSGGVLITWTVPGTTYSEFVQDNGLFVVPASTLKKLAGRGRFVLTRFRNDNHTYKGRKVVVTRLAQRIYTVTVQP